MSRRLVGAVGCLLVAAAIVAAFVVGRHTAPRPSAAPSPTAPGAVDVGFAQDMAVHHAQAVTMANLAVTRGDPAVVSIADAILTGQSQEAGQLRGWLQLWHEPQADAHPMRWMAGSAGAMSSTDATAMDATAMPGMASGAQLTRLYRLRGKAFDVSFLQLMIRHHQGGIEMAHYAELHARLAVVRQAATAMRVEQVEDLAQMRPLLQADGGRPLPAP